MKTAQEVRQALEDARKAQEEAEMAIKQAESDITEAEADINMVRFSSFWHCFECFKQKVDEMKILNNFFLSSYSEHGHKRKKCSSIRDYFDVLKCQHLFSAV